MIPLKDKACEIAREAASFRQVRDVSTRLEDIEWREWMDGSTFLAY